MNMLPPLRKKSYESHRSKLKATSVQEADESMLRAAKDVRSMKKFGQDGVVKYEVYVEAILAEEGLQFIQWLCAHRLLKPRRGLMLRPWHHSAKCAKR